MPAVRRRRGPARRNAKSGVRTRAGASEATLEAARRAGARAESGEWDGDGAAVRNRVWTWAGEGKANVRS